MSDQVDAAGSIWSGDAAARVEALRVAASVYSDEPADRVVEAAREFAKFLVNG